MKEACIHKGVRQGCNLSPVLFNLCIEKGIEESKEVKEGIKINGVAVKMIRFADDIAVLEDSGENLQDILTKMNRFYKRNII